MAPKLRFQFDANQEHQLTAVESITALFEGFTRQEADFHLGDEIVANLPPYDDLAELWMLSNLQAVQKHNRLAQQMFLDFDSGMGLAGISDENHRFPHFTVEMETGTGKTYVYLRTIYELRRRCGWSKFVVVVPSIAIYEGVIKNAQVTRDHFRALYGNEPFDLIPYDGNQLSRLRHFATANTVTVLLLTLDAFNKASNNLYKASEKLPGERLPFQFVQETRPILILDEPQNMESERAKEALRTLKPVFALRFSATHRTSPNLVYRLTPFDAYRRNLVKRIEVYGVTERDNANTAFLTLAEITPPPRITAKVRTRVTDRSGTRDAEVVLRQGEDLAQKTGRPEHHGFVVENIDFGAGFLEFENGERLYLLVGMVPSRPSVFREQIRQTIRRHMQWQMEVAEHDIKVLSLFFIDRVANYTASDGLIRILFDEEFEHARHDFDAFKHFRPEEVRQAYFAKKKQKDGKEEEIDTGSRTTADRELEKQAFALIMRDKERLLSFEEPVSFIFAHSALKEGWDNPNVFQICTLNQTVSEVKKRQEIGRGLRLAVDQRGARVYKEEVNVLTVVANESYHEYAGRLQSEYVADGDAPPPAPTNARQRKDATRNDNIFYHNEHFQMFWEKLNQRLRYHLRVDTPTRIDECVTRINRQTFPGHILVVERGKIVLSSFKIKVERASASKAQITFSLFDADGEPETISRTFKPGDDIARALHDDRLRNLGTLEIESKEGEYRAVFTNTQWRLAEAQEVEYTPEGFGGYATRREIQDRTEHYPAFNLIDRAARQTGMTRPTINAIFHRLRDEHKQRFLVNPEGFATIFINELRNALADHVTERIEFTVDDGAPPYDLSEIFPPKRSYPQKEILEAGSQGLYDLVQKDSDVEQQYVEAIRQEGNAIVFYFKFPPGFKVDLPNLIGNYNPDWGIARIDLSGQVQVRTFVHETKGSMDVAKLQFPHERRKIKCAQKYFASIGVNYLTVDPKKTGKWWQEVGGQFLS